MLDFYCDIFLALSINNFSINKSPVNTYQCYSTLIRGCNMLLQYAGIWLYINENKKETEKDGNIL